MTTATAAPPTNTTALAPVTRMKAYVRSAYGSAEVLRLTDVPCGVPRDGEVLVRVRATSVNAADKYVLQGRPVLMRFIMGLFRPMTPGVGLDLAGEVVSVGAGVTRLKVGDAVFGTTPEDFGGDVDRAWAEYARVPEALLALKPARVSFEQVAALPVAGLTALHGLRDAGELKAGQHVLINGASGGVGTFAVQIARALGAEVTAVCSTSNVEQARALGANHVIDYTREDHLAGPARFDLILDVSASRSVRANRRVLRPGGLYVMAGAVDRGGLTGPLGPFLRGMIASRFSDRVRFANAKSSLAKLETLAGLVEAGKMRAVIEQTYRFEALPEAIARFERGHVRGKLVVSG